ncbi:hypothetical protein [Paenibacillus pabuli]|uniref:hypothetical protein n=2 Tax=Paenibacillus TaxID=44249 RepID=UPI00117E6933
MKTMKKKSFLLTIQLTASPINDNASKKKDYPCSNDRKKAINLVFWLIPLCRFYLSMSHHREISFILRISYKILSKKRNLHPN